jgi:dihydrofolate reductase
MKKIIVQEFVTLNGFIEDAKDQQMKWVTDSFNEEMAKEQLEATRKIDTILLGRITYDILSAYWPTSAARERDPEMSAHLNNAAKIIFSTTLSDPQWNNSTVMRSINYENIQTIKEGNGKNIAICGSTSVVQELLNLGLIDEFYLTVFPIVVGDGKGLFDNIKDRQKLNLIELKTFNSGVITLLYACAKQDSDHHKEGSL